MNSPTNKTPIHDQTHPTAGNSIQTTQIQTTNQEAIDFQTKFPNKLSPDGTTIKSQSFSGQGHSFKPPFPTGFAIPSTVTKIEDHAFSFSKLLAGFTIPTTVTTIDPTAFIGDDMPRGYKWTVSATDKTPIQDQGHPAAGNSVQKI